ncbi:tetratricopeptide repeat protein [Spongiimicrobium salis]|uniref:tetratricopeptide repeat protein n=1 Tax=Spongiimicrobium salis TaxID=1667022 RepID=UPI00374DDD3C
MKSYLSSLWLLLLLLFGMMAYVVQDKMLATVLTNSGDYNSYLDITPSDSARFFELWDVEIQSDSTTTEGLEIIVELYNSYFQSTGNIQYLKKAEQALKKIIQQNTKNSGMHYTALSRNYMAQHRYEDALQIADTVEQLDVDINRSKNLLFDMHMELGNYQKAKMYLDSIKNTTTFEYMRRLAHWKDYKGDVQATLKLMEQARLKAEDEGNKKEILQSYQELAAYYYEAAVPKKAYDYFLKVLTLDSYNMHAKKGIAKIVYFHERNANEAMRILEAISSIHNTSDYYLLKAEIASAQKDSTEVYANIDYYYQSVQNPDYGSMQHPDKSDFHLNKTKQYIKAIALAKNEVIYRPSLKSYDLLAYSHFKNGDIDKALEVLEEHVSGVTHEPSILYHKAEIYKAIGDTDKVAQLKKELLEGVFVLQPSMKIKVAKL